MGATGFIGGRLVEKLFLEHHQVPKCLVRDFSKLPRIARFPITIVQGDILYPEKFENEVKDCDIYIHCAYGKEKDKELNWKTDTVGTRNLLKLAVKNKVKHFIFLSTTAIYEGEFEEGVFDETIYPEWKKKDYAGGKLEAERICLEYSKKYNLPVTILRPTIVYGPYAKSWTIYPVELIRKGILKAFDNFSGVCNPVYVDDVVGSILTAIMNKNAFNHTFIVSSGETMSWNRFFNSFSTIINGKPLSKSSRLAYISKYLRIIFIKKGVKFVFALAPNFTKSVYRYLRSKGIGDWSWAKGEDISTIDLNYYKKRLEFKIDKLRNKLGYEPKYSFDMGLKITGEWLKHHRYL